MSAIYFHTEAELERTYVSGRERAYMGTFCGDLLLMTLGLTRTWPSDAKKYRRLVPVDHYAHVETDDIKFVRTLSTWLHVGQGEFGVTTKVEPWVAALNTALAIGGDALRLMARLHGQCEIHTYVEGPNRGWLADIIDNGRASGLLRSGQNWERVSALLSERDDAPVVTSYSVCQQFPNPHRAGWSDDEDGEGFWRLSDSERWALGMAALRRDADGLEMKPDNWESFHFDNGASAFTVLEELHQASDAVDPVAGESTS